MCRNEFVLKNCIVKYFYTLFIFVITKNVYYNFIVNYKGPLCETTYLSNRPHISVGYKLINHAGCW